MSKSVLIVGASSGIGHEVFQLGKKYGYDLYTISRSPVEGSSHHIQKDIFEVTKEDLAILPDTLNGLVYTPGSITLKPFTALKPTQFEEDYKINVLGYVHALQLSIGRLKKGKNGSVVAFSTVAAKTGINFHASIAAAKGALEAMNRSLAAEYALSSVRFNAIAPSLTDTPLAGDLLSSDSKREASEKRHPLAQIGNPKHIASLVLFLLSDESSWVTGQTFGVDGGMSTLRPL